MITVHFDGHSKVWDGDYELPAFNKLAPFRKFTLPFTGPSERLFHRPFVPLNI